MKVKILVIVKIIMMPVQQTPLGYIVTKVEIAQNKELFLLSQCFQLNLIIRTFFMEIFHVFDIMFAADLLYAGKG